MKEVMSHLRSCDMREVRAVRIDALIELLLDISQETNNLRQNAGLWVHAQRFFEEAQECDEVLDKLK